MFLRLNYTMFTTSNVFISFPFSKFEDIYIMWDTARMSMTRSKTKRRKLRNMLLHYLSPSLAVFISACGGHCRGGDSWAPLKNRVLTIATVLFSKKRNSNMLFLVIFQVYSISCIEIPLDDRWQKADHLKLLDPKFTTIDFDNYVIGPTFVLACRLSSSLFVCLACDWKAGKLWKIFLHTYYYFWACPYWFFAKAINDFVP